MVDKFQASNRSNSAGQPFYAAGTYVKAASRQGFQQRSSTIPNEVEKHPNSTAISLGMTFVRDVGWARWILARARALLLESSVWVI